MQGTAGSVAAAARLLLCGSMAVRVSAGSALQQPFCSVPAVGCTWVDISDPERCHRARGYKADTDMCALSRRGVCRDAFAGNDGSIYLQHGSAADAEGNGEE